jgi:hypothetical protein
MVLTLLSLHGTLVHVAAVAIATVALRLVLAAAAVVVLVAVFLALVPVSENARTGGAVSVLCCVWGGVRLTL